MINHPHLCEHFEPNANNLSPLEGDENSEDFTSMQKGSYRKLTTYLR